MEERDIHELSDEALDEATGGSKDPAMYKRIWCKACKEKKVWVQLSGYDQVTCPGCKATLICMDGNVVIISRKVT